MIRAQGVLGALLCSLLLTLGCGRPTEDAPPLVEAPPADEAPAEPIERFWAEGPAHEELETLEPPISPEESRALRAGFDWKHTQPLAETTAEGHPALYYSLVYVRTKDQVRSLDAYHIHHSFLPIFAEERSRWRGKAGVFDHQGDGKGLFAFAVLPGRLYNAIREQALAGRVAFEAVVPRAVPVGDAVGDDGALSYRYLAREGFRYRNLDAIRPGEDRVATTAQPIFGWIARNIIEPIAEAGEDLVDGIRQGIGELDQLLSGEARLNIELLLLATDPSFGPHVATVPAAVLKQGWGANRGQALTLPGVELRAFQGLSLHTKDIGADGKISIVVAADRDTQLCMNMQNGAAELTTFLTEVEVCDFGVSGDYVIGEDDVNGTTPHVIHVRHRWVNALAQFTDARRYITDVADYDGVADAQVLVGELANLWPNAATPCLDYFNLSFSGGATAISGALTTLLAPGPLPVIGGLAIPITEIAEFLFSVDIVLPDDAARSRGTPTHEYAHYAMCSMLYDVDALDPAWSDVMVQSLECKEGVVDDLLDCVRRADDEASVIAEGWADLLSGQIAGGVNYFKTGGSRSGRLPLSDDDGMWYCNPDAPLWDDLLDADRHGACLEENAGGPTDETFPFYQISDPEQLDEDPFNRAIARSATLLHDMFDGHPDTSPLRTNVPGNGAAWPRAGGSPTFLFDTSTVRDGRAANDEAVALPGTALFELIEEWRDDGNSTLDTVEWEQALARVMQNHGYTDDQICELFRRHDPTATCPSHLPMAQNATPARPAVTGVVLPDRRGRWTWDDFSAAATSYRYTVTDVTGGGSRVLYSGSLAYSRHATYTTPLALPFNSEIRFEVRTVNGLRVGAPADHRLFTPAEAVPSITSGAALPERVRLTWNGTRAARYVIEKRAVGETLWTAAAEVDDAVAASQTFDVFGLLGGRAYDFRIVALNLVSEPAAPSATRRLTPIQPEPLHVATAGDDAHPEAGSAAHPYRTLDAALDRIDDEIANGNARFSAVLLKVASGNYILSRAYTVSSGRYLRIAGKHDTSTWNPTAGATRVVASAFERSTASCSSTLFTGWGEGALDTLAALVARGGSMLALTDIAVEAAVEDAEVGDDEFTDCHVVANAESSNLWLSGAALSTTGDTVIGSCRLAAQATSAGYAAQVLIEKGSTLVGVKTDVTRLPILEQLGGLCVHGAELLTLTGSTIAAVEGPSLAVGSSQVIAVGLLTERVGSVRIGRSETSSALGNLDWSIGTGFQAGASLGGESVFMHNSVARTAQAGTRNSPLILSGSGSGRAHLYENTLAAGEDYESTGPTSPGQIGAVLVLAGSYDSFQMINNLLSYAAGAAAGTQIVGIDRRGGSTDPRSFVMQGNAFSIPPHDDRALSICHDEEFGSYGQGEFLNVSFPNSCRRPMDGYSNTVSLNLELTGPPLDTTSPHARVALAPNGQVAALNLGTLLLLGYGGLPLTGNPYFPEVQVDRAGVTRLAATPAIGAFYQAAP